ncbi:MAG: NADH-quinone oxidoreductase subunit N, partial [Nannocystaceae bacterium]|nr:NADH-quinone oxidoreductase subunit N [Nannocystaceae bacterium]
MIFETMILETMMIDTAMLGATVGETVGALAMWVPEFPAVATAAEPVAKALTASERTMADMGHIGGMVILAVWALLLLLSDAFAGVGTRNFQRRLALVGVAFAFAAIASQFGEAEYDAGVRIFARFLVVDQFSMLVDMALLAVVAAVIMFSGDYARTHRFEYGEQEALLFIAVFGMMILSHAANLLALFLGIETMSIAVYVLVGARWNKRESAEAAFKYFVMGAFSSGILLMGLALLYGGTGTLDLREIQGQIMGAFNAWGGAQSAVSKLSEPHLLEGARLVHASTAVKAIAPAMLIIPGILMTLGALLFKISAVPFHMWTPDAYEGAPTPVTGFMAVGVKIAGFAALLKLFVGTLYFKRLVEAPYGWTSIVAIVALASMTVGNLAALRQGNIKRLLAYSSVAHVGYLLIGVVAAASFYGSARGTAVLQNVDQEIWAQQTGDAAIAGVLFYLGAYGIATLGAFACVAWLGSNKKEAVAVHEWSGLASRHPGMAFGMMVCLLSLMGLPPTAGFIGKLMVFKSGLENSNMLLRILVVLALINSVIGAYYYLRLIVNMYFRASLANPVVPMTSRGAQGVLAVATFATLAMGIGADPVLRRCELAAAGFQLPAEDPSRAAWVDRLRARWEAEDADADSNGAAEDDGADERTLEVPDGGPDAAAKGTEPEAPTVDPEAPVVAPTRDAVVG